MADNGNVSCQPLLDRLTHVMLKSKMMRKFKNFKNFEEKLYYCLSNEYIKYDESTNISIKNEINDLLQVFYSLSSKHLKSEEIANKLKIKGSKAFLKKRDEAAYGFYTDGLRQAPDESPLLPILYANRSATCIQQKKYKECLEDIERAEKTGYPIDAQYKLHKRKIEALFQLGRKKEAQWTLEQARGCSVSVDKDNFLKSLKDLEEKIQHLDLDTNGAFEGGNDPPLQLFQEEQEKQISGALDIRVNNEDGRHICAVSDIPAGSTLFREQPFAAILLPEYFLTHCQGCFSPLTNPIPCKRCCDVLWCNEKCRSDGEVFHKYECGSLHIISSVGIAHLALRIVLAAGWTICQIVQKEFKMDSAEEDPTVLFNSRDEKYRYKAVFSLLTHLEKDSLDEQFQYSLAAIILTKVLIDRTDFFPRDHHLCKEVSSGNMDLHVQVASILVRHISQLVCNAHAITQIEGSTGGPTSALSQISQKRIASAIYPLASLMNHSCKPSIINSFRGDTLVIHSIQEIKKGDQLYNCYGPHACRQERADRQSALDRQYFFNCKCEACSDDESLIKEASWSGIMCPKCRGIAATIDNPESYEKEFFRCLECKISQQLPQDLIRKCSDVNTLYEEGQESFKYGNYEEAEKLYLKSLKGGEQLFTENNEFLNTIRDDLAKCYAVQGKYKDSSRQLSSCLKVVERRFGGSSVEMAHELLKYFDVIRMVKDFKSDLKKEVEPTWKRINDIFTLHYGVRWENYLKLEGV